MDPLRYVLTPPDRFDVAKMLDFGRFQTPGKTICEPSVNMGVANEYERQFPYGQGLRLSCNHKFARRDLQRSCNIANCPNVNRSAPLGSFNCSIRYGSILGQIILA